MTSHTFLILIRDGGLALAVGAALEERLAKYGFDALGLVPAIRGLEFADAGYDRHLRARGADPVAGRAPKVVALYEDGLLRKLESLGLAAYVGVPQAEEWRIVHWDNDAGAILLPVTSARDLVDAVAVHTPWSRYAAGMPEVASPRHRNGRTALGGSPVLSRKLAVASAAGVAGSLLLVGAPPATAVANGAASSSTTQASQAAAASNGAIPAVETAYITSQEPSNGSAVSEPAPPGAPESSGAPSAFSQFTTGVQSFFSQVGTAFQRGMEAYGQAEITNAQANLAMGQMIVAAAPYAYQGFLNGAEQGLLIGTATGTAVGGVGGFILGGPPGALAGLKAGAGGGTRDAAVLSRAAGALREGAVL